MASTWRRKARSRLTAMVGLALRTSGRLRRTGLVVAVLGALFLALDVATQAVPPWLFAFLWMAVGVGLLRRPAPSST
ncbi:hypothetical protein Ga0074812_13478 [Parafrankia irregularis]|uniref:Uncharacterized protein n=1 Tax=Parafrankia irregularis TaxID=795642 RepID=A0A0S4QY23_9ACTN|nr:MULTISPECIES: hypothetical protein [Parafrankia]MBE3202789.1 hypothetical protein [Parafrankia sp. CH37]CUU60047.1 hypothetical protein Ga0074812_13478 [Parafrankia irregularis]